MSSRIILSAIILRGLRGPTGESKKEMATRSEKRMKFLTSLIASEVRCVCFSCHDLRAISYERRRFVGAKFTYLFIFAAFLMKRISSLSVANLILVSHAR